jgi:hypothetical protein
VLNAAVHATHGLIDSTSMWPEKSLRTAGLADILTGMALQGLEWLGTGASGSASAPKRVRQKRPPIVGPEVTPLRSRRPRMAR